MTFIDRLDWIFGWRVYRNKASQTVWELRPICTPLAIVAALCGKSYHVSYRGSGRVRLALLRAAQAVGCSLRRKGGTNA